MKTTEKKTMPGPPPPSPTPLLGPKAVFISLDILNIAYNFNIYARGKNIPILDDVCLKHVTINELNTILFNQSRLSLRTNPPSSC